MEGEGKVDQVDSGAGPYFNLAGRPEGSIYRDLELEATRYRRHGKRHIRERRGASKENSPWRASS